MRSRLKDKAMEDLRQVIITLERRFHIQLMPTFCFMKELSWRKIILTTRRIFFQSKCILKTWSWSNRFRFIRNVSSMRYKNLTRNTAWRILTRVWKIRILLRWRWIKSKNKHSWNLLTSTVELFLFWVYLLLSRVTFEPKYLEVCWKFIIFYLTKHQHTSLSSTWIHLLKTSSHIATLHIEKAWQGSLKETSSLTPGFLKSKLMMKIEWRVNWWEKYLMLFWHKYKEKRCFLPWVKLKHISSWLNIWCNMSQE